MHKAAQPRRDLATAREYFADGIARLRKLLAGQDAFFREPDVAVWALGYPRRLGAGTKGPRRQGQRDLRKDVSDRIEYANMIGIGAVGGLRRHEFREVQVAVRAKGELVRFELLAVNRRDGKFCNHEGVAVYFSDLVGAEFGDPGIAGRVHGDAGRGTVDRGNAVKRMCVGNLREIKLANPVAVHLIEIRPPKAMAYAADGPRLPVDGN